MQFSKVEAVWMKFYLLCLLGQKDCWSGFRNLSCGVLPGLYALMVTLRTLLLLLWWIENNKLAHCPFVVLPQAWFLEFPACFLITMNNSWPDDLFMSQTSFVRGSFDFYKWSSSNLLAIFFLFFQEWPKWLTSESQQKFYFTLSNSESFTE